MSASPHGTDGHDVDNEVPETEIDSPVAAQRGPTGSETDTSPRYASPDWRPTRGRWLADLLGARARMISALLAGALLYVVVDIFVQGPLTQLDITVGRWDGEQDHPRWSDAAWIYDKMGQRSVLVPILLVVAGVFARRHRTWRPVVLAMVSFLVLNVVVGAMKILIGRAETETGSVDVLAGGVIFPSGHSSNMVLSGGLVIYLMWRYGENPPLRRMTVLIAALTMLTILTSLYIGSHWLTDLVAGVLVGGLLLQSVILFDRATLRFRERPPWALRPVWSLLRRLQPDRYGVDAVPVARRGLRGVVEDVPEVRPASTAPDLRTTHEV
jgi:membrane-associated phospholipid phosphatase